ncbi:MAG: hypothetical protein KKE29_21450 [Proteobacteria bacterium]|nr:hypothetical protein [Pseudomonadota bacterium]MBU4577159.1 hypothetical protein [Pseudomonadota bacterium]MBU4599139.1 hypothetical protein [Pseudomonadota bacterium]
MTYGKKIEKNIVQSLKLGGIKLEESLELDAHFKTDARVKQIGRQEIPGGLALQVSLQDDLVKVKLAKQCALRASRLFLYLLVREPNLFSAPSRDIGRDLGRIMQNLLPRFKQGRALLVSIGRQITVQTI